MEQQVLVGGSQPKPSKIVLKVAITVGKLPEVQEKLQGTFDHILTDETQDTTTSLCCSESYECLDELHDVRKNHA